MDRRHLVLAVAVLGVVADERAGPPPFFEGYEVLDVGSLQIKPGDSTTWIVKADVQLPPEAELGFSSWLHVFLDPQDGERQFSVAARTCGNETILTEITVPDENDTGEHEEPYLLWLSGLFAGCPSAEPCERAVCLDASNETDAGVTLNVEIQAGLESDTGEYGSDETVDVPIALSFEVETGS